MSWSLPEAHSGDTLKPYDLRCEHRATPLGIGTPVPQLSWRLASDRRGDAQRAYRIRVHARALVWDSGWVEGQDVSADYGGAPLTSFTRYTWQIELRGGESAQSWFDTGVLHPDEWRSGTPLPAMPSAGGSDSPLVQAVGVSGAALVCRVASGRYAFTAAWE